jgi:hypothetical protein
LDSVSVRVDEDPETGLLKLGVYFTNERFVLWDAKPEKIGDIDLETGLVVMQGKLGARYSFLSTVQNESNRIGTDWEAFYTDKTFAGSSFEQISSGGIGLRNGVVARHLAMGEVGVGEGLTEKAFNDVISLTSSADNLAWQSVLFSVTAPIEVGAGMLRFRALSLPKGTGTSAVKWGSNASKRGFFYEGVMSTEAHRLWRNAKTIDTFHEGVATSIKTIDLTATSYAGRGAFRSKLRQYACKLSQFAGTQRTRGGVVIDAVDAADVSSRVLKVGVQRGQVDARVYMEFIEAYNYAKSLDVPVHIWLVEL